MTHRRLDDAPDRITLSSGRRGSRTASRADRNRQAWTLAGGVAGSVMLFWVMVQLGQASSQAQPAVPMSATAIPPVVTGAAPGAQSEQAACGPAVAAVEPSAQGPAIETPREIIAMLDLRKQDLDRREQAVRRDEERLLVLRAEVESLLTRSEAMQKQLEEARNTIQKQTTEQKLRQDQFLADRKALGAKHSQEQKNQSQMQLAKIYESMPAEEAAVRLERMADRKAVEMLRLVKGKTAGAILAQMKADRAAKLTEQLLAPAP